MYSSSSSFGYGGFGFSGLGGYGDGGFGFPSRRRNDYSLGCWITANSLGSSCDPLFHTLRSIPLANPTSIQLLDTSAATPTTSIADLPNYRPQLSGSQYTTSWNSTLTSSDPIAGSLNYWGKTLKPDIYGYDANILWSESFMDATQTIQGIEMTSWANWKKGVGDIIVSTNLVLKPDGFYKPRGSIDYQSPSWKDCKANISVGGDSLDLTGIYSSHSFINAALRPVKCRCDPLNPDLNCLCQVAYLNLEIGAGHNWEGGGVTKINVGNLWNKKAGSSIRATHKQPVGKNCSIDINAERRASPWAKSSLAWGIKCVVDFLG